MIDSDPQKCSALLRQGHWIEAPGGRWAQAPDKPTHKIWQAPGCMIHHYNAGEMSACLSSMTIVGDSTARQLFWAMARRLDLNRANLELQTAEKHEDLDFSLTSIRLSFSWDPFLNSTSPIIGNGTDSMLIASGGLWYARYDEIPLERFAEALQRLQLGRRSSLSAILY